MSNDHRPEDHEPKQETSQDSTHETTAPKEEAWENAPTPSKKEVEQTPAAEGIVPDASDENPAFFKEPQKLNRLGSSLPPESINHFFNILIILFLGMLLLAGLYAAQAFHMQNQVEQNESTNTLLLQQKLHDTTHYLQDFEDNGNQTALVKAYESTGSFLTLAEQTKNVDTSLFFLDGRPTNYAAYDVMQVQHQYLSQLLTEGMPHYEEDTQYLYEVVHHLSENLKQHPTDQYMTFVERSNIFYNELHESQE